MIILTSFISYEISLDYEVEEEVSPSTSNNIENESNNTSSISPLIEDAIQSNEISQINDDGEKQEELKQEEAVEIELVKEEEFVNPWSMTFENTKNLLKEFTESSMRIHRLSEEMHEFCSTITSLTYK